MVFVFIGLMMHKGRILCVCFTITIIIFFILRNYPFRAQSLAKSRQCSIPETARPAYNCWRQLKCVMARSRLPEIGYKIKTRVDEYLYLVV